MARTTHRYRPALESPLEERLVLARLERSPLAQVAVLAARRPKVHPPLNRQPTPAQFIDQQYAGFLADFRAAEALYLDSLQGVPPAVTTSTTSLTQPFDPAVGIFQVADASIFPVPTMLTPVQLTASVAGNPVGLYQAASLSGNSFTQLQIFDSTLGEFRPFKNPMESPPPTPPLDQPLPVGTTIQATFVTPGVIGTTFLDDFQAYTVTRLQTMAQEIVAYYNRLPLQLPRSPGPPRRPGPRNAVQLVVFRQLVGSGEDSLLSELLVVPPPSTTSPAEVAFYDANTATIVNTSRNSLFEAIRLTFRREDAIGGGLIPTIPARAQIS